MDELEKGSYSKCSRCGNPSGGKSRCKACLKKLSAKRKTPGTKERSWQHADQALRRERGGSGTTTGGHKSGHGNRQEIQRKMKAAEKKTGSKLSLDRKNNEQGYKSSNTRAVPQNLNRGRHHVDGKKLAAWRKKLKKSNIDTATLYTLLKAKAYESNNQDLLKGLSVEYIEDLFKEAALKLPESQPHPLDQHVGKTHTVEIHPDMDMMYRAKGLIKESNKPHLSVVHFKQAGFPKDIINKLPRTADGHVTPELIDEHIANLPKQKVDIKVEPYTWGSQQHRSGKQYAITAHLHEDSLKNMRGEQRNLWNSIQDDQHKFNSDLSNNKQFGWARIDAHSKPDHWHVDEIQSDFQNKDKINRKIERQLPEENFSVNAYRLNDRQKFEDDHNVILDPEFHSKTYKEMPFYNEMSSLYEKLNSAKTQQEHNDTYDQIEDTYKKHGIIKSDEEYKDRYNKEKEKIENTNKNIETHRKNSDKLLSSLSHGHQDPQHAIHSAVNALGRKLGVKSMSMDMPEDQAKQSGLITSDNQRAQTEQDDATVNNALSNAIDDYIGNSFTKDSVEKEVKAHGNPNLKSAFNKVGYDNIAKDLANSFTGSEPSIDLSYYINDRANQHNLSDPEKDALKEYLSSHIESGPSYDDFDHLRTSDDEPDQEEFDMSRLPVHQIDTYHKRPKRLGMKVVPKTDILGDDAADSAENVQYMNLHKKLQTILNSIQELKKGGSSFDKKSIRFRHSRSESSDTHAHYDIHHSGQKVGTILVNKKNGVAGGANLHPSAQPHSDFIHEAASIFHKVKNLSN